MRGSWFSLRTAICLVGMLTAMSGCIVVDNDGSQNSTPPGSDDQEQCCRDVQVCETQCDDTGCYDDCETETRCPDACNADCTGDFDCPSNTVCIEGTCSERNFDRTGTGGLCQSCSTAYDCAEPDARCIRLYFERTPGGGPKVCATDCENEADCPYEFDCVDQPNSPSVCVPEEEFGSTDRVCPDEPNFDVECFSSDHCGPGESCINNECLVPDGECTDDGECGGSAVCRNFECVNASEPECIDRTDCNTDALCVDGQCEPRNPDGNCVKNDECRGDALCVDGSCRTQCSDRSECNTSSEICRQGLCVPIECRFNSDCGSEEVCVDAECKPSCTDGSDCNSGYVCSQPGDYCRRDPNVECRSDAECLSDEQCHNGKCAQICNCNQQCASGEVCNDEATDSSNTGLCEDPEQEPETSECTNNCECPSGQVCDEGTCRSD